MVLGRQQLKDPPSRVSGTFKTCVVWAQELSVSDNLVLNQSILFEHEVKCFKNADSVGQVIESYYTTTYV